MKFNLPIKRSNGELKDTDEIADKEKYAKKPKGPSTKSIKLSKKSEFILTIGDDGAILIYLHDKQVEGRWFAAEPTEDNLEIFNKAIANNESAPITIVLDTMDQYYSQQTLPPVSKMSVGGLLKRRAQREFSRTIELKGHYFLNRNDKKEWNYMMFALEVDEQTQLWFDWVAQQLNPPKGVRVLPLEAAEMVQILAEKDTQRHPEKYEQPKGWKYLVSYNKVSGVRQVILKDNKMIFTRLGQPLEGDASTEAGAIEQEVISTVEYLKRIGLKTIHDLHLYIVASQDIMEVIDSKRMGVESHTLLSPHTLCQMFGWDGVAQPEDRFGDIVLAAFIASFKKSKNILWTKSLQKIRQLYMAIPAIRAVGAMIILSAVGGTLLSIVEYWGHSQDIADNEGKRQSLQQQLAELKTQIDVPAEELERILQTFDVYKALKKQQLNPKTFLLHTVKATQALPEHVRIQSINWQKQTLTQPSNQPPPAPTAISSSSTPVPKGTPINIKGDLHVNTLVSSDIRSEALKKHSNDMVEQLRPYFPHYTIMLAEIPGAKGAQDSINIDFSEEIDTTTRQQRVTLKTTFTGIEYIPEVLFEGSP